MTTLTVTPAAGPTYGGEPKTLLLALDPPGATETVSVDWGDASPVEQHTFSGTLTVEHAWPGRANYTLRAQIKTPVVEVPVSVR